ncbi:hypothetical protein PR048_023682 [Dryococelus australis]|uniref:Uncharacterized protein n=1 Tax=Dryococelus australis TaxID=614101 RepID=A0ABQ9GUV6_9NEOP|nr:hypothetical protein PR048_023682 [Dryococelus australis]
MDQRRNAWAGETGDPRENSPTSGIVRHDSRLHLGWGRVVQLLNHSGPKNDCHPSSSLSGADSTLQKSAGRGGSPVVHLFRRQAEGVDVLSSAGSPGVTARSRGSDDP